MVSEQFFRGHHKLQFLRRPEDRQSRFRVVADPLCLKHAPIRQRSLHPMRSMNHVAAGQD